MVDSCLYVFSFCSTASPCLLVCLLHIITILCRYNMWVEMGYIIIILLYKIAQIYYWFSLFFRVFQCKEKKNSKNVSTLSTSTSLTSLLCLTHTLTHCLNRGNPLFPLAECVFTHRRTPLHSRTEVTHRVKGHGPSLNTYTYSVYQTSPLTEAVYAFLLVYY